MKSSPKPLAVPTDDGEAVKVGRQSLYLSLASALTRDIQQGRYAIGDSLPPETVLSQRYGVSRHTVRQAIRELKEQGLVASRAGIGTKVRGRPDEPRFFSGINSISDLLQFVDATEMHAFSRRELQADEFWAAQLRCPVGQVWSEACFVRKVPGADAPMSFISVYVKVNYADVTDVASISRTPIYRRIEERYGVRIVEVQQEITAAALTLPIAKALQAENGQPALKITRYYLDKDANMVQISIGYYPSERYTQSVQFRAQPGEA